MKNLHPSPEEQREFLANVLAANCSDEVKELRADFLRRFPETKDEDERFAPKVNFPAKVDLINGSDVKIEPISWLWNGWLAEGKLHILAGNIGTGKTSIAMALAASISCGGRFPDGSRAKPGNVVIWSGEDASNDTLAPRLKACGSDMGKIFFAGSVTEGSSKRTFDPAIDMESLQRSMAEISGGVSLLILDPIVSAVAGDSHKNAETRRGLQPLVDLAASLQCAVLGITHFSKNSSGRNPSDRVTGSLAFGALARIVLVATKGEHPTGERIFLRAKSNIGRDDGGFHYSLQQLDVPGSPSVQTSAVLWGGAVEGTAREILEQAEGAEGEVGGAQEVAAWLSDLMNEENGEVDRRDVMKAATSMGYKERSVYRAKDKLGITVHQLGFGRNKRSVWRLGQSCQGDPILPILPDKNLGEIGKIGEGEAHNLSRSHSRDLPPVSQSPNSWKGVHREI